MNKSLEYLLKRKKEDDARGWIKTFNFKKAQHFDFFEILGRLTRNEIKPNKDGELSIKSGTIIHDKDVCFEVIVKKSKENDFNFYTSDGNYSDGTFLFLREVIYKVIERVITGQTFPIPQYTLEQVLFAIESGEYIISYEVGDIIFGMQDVKKSPDEEKPWCTSLSCAFLPIKYSLIKKETKE